jgi:hypothetical protein
MQGTCRCEYVHSRYILVSHPRQLLYPECKTYVISRKNGFEMGVSGYGANFSGWNGLGSRKRLSERHISMLPYGVGSDAEKN